MSECVPDSIVRRKHSLLLRWSDGDKALHAAELRAACRCADCRASALRGYPEKADTSIALTHVNAVGSYALQLAFSDGHDRGIYPWRLLRELSSRG
jgi:DUF971 family protein